MNDERERAVTLILHRSDVNAPNGETEDSLARSFDATDAWCILYRRNSGAWADVLTVRLSGPEAQAIARRLRRHVRERSKRGWFRNHRHVFSGAEAAHLALLVGWLERAGAAGCAVWSALDSSGEPLPLPNDADVEGGVADPPSDDATGAAHAAGLPRPITLSDAPGAAPPADDGALAVPERPGAAGIMPAWMPEELKDTAWGQGQ